LITQAVDLARSEINKTIAASDAATKQSATYHNWTDDNRSEFLSESISIGATQNF